MWPPPRVIVIHWFVFFSRGFHGRTGENEDDEMSSLCEGAYFSE